MANYLHQILISIFLLTYPRLAHEGMMFTDAYAGEPVCAPSRCSLMTGRHTGHTIVRGNYFINNSDLPLRENDFTIAELLKVLIDLYNCFNNYNINKIDS